MSIYEILAFGGFIIITIFVQYKNRELFDYLQNHEYDYMKALGFVKGSLRDNMYNQKAVKNYYLTILMNSNLRVSLQSSRSIKKIKESRFLFIAYLIFFFIINIVNVFFL